MNILVIDESTKKDIQDVIDYAKQHPVSLEDMMLIADNEKKSPVGFEPGYVCHINNGYRVVYSIEEHPCGWCKHISISLEGDKVPLPSSVDKILGEFKFKLDMKSIKIWVEEGYGPLGNKFKAVNLVQLLEKKV